MSHGERMKRSLTEFSVPIQPFTIETANKKLKLSATIPLSSKEEKLRSLLILSGKKLAVAQKMEQESSKD